MLSTTAMLECAILQIVHEQLGTTQACTVEKLINMFLHRNRRHQTKKVKFTAERSLETWLCRKSSSGVPACWCGWGRQDTYETLVIWMGPTLVQKQYPISSEASPSHPSPCQFTRWTTAGSWSRSNTCWHSGKRRCSSGEKKIYSTSLQTTCTGVTAGISPPHGRTTTLLSKSTINKECCCCQIAPSPGYDSEQTAKAALDESTRQIATTSKPQQLLDCDWIY